MNAHDTGHFVDFLAHDDELVEVAADFLVEGLRSECSCIAVFSHDHRLEIHAKLEQRLQDLEALTAARRLIVLDAEAILATLWINDHLDVREFYHRFAAMIRPMNANGREVRLVGEVVGLLAQIGRFDAVLQVEDLCNDLARECTFKMYCMYCEAPFYMPLDEASRRRVCAVHSGSLRTS